MMLINLYTSRLILNTLGVSDFGIYNVVGSIIGMLGFITGSLSGASSRFLTFELGKKDIDKLSRIFGSVKFIHYLLAGVILLVGETVGVLFVLTQLKIPEGRLTAAMWVFQFSILASIISIISVPYNSDIIAHEKMSAFAYLSLFDSVLKLLIVYLLVITPYDKLVIYAFLLLCIQVIDRILYYVYCHRRFIETHSRAKYDKELFRKISSYAGWTITGELAVVGYTQGLNILLNIFFGPAINAARGIAVQVQNVCQQFSTNFQMALNPQITKTYAQGNLERMHSLIIHGSKFSFYILLFIAIPLMIEAPFVLNIWLGIVPDHLVNFLRLTLVLGLLFTLYNFIVVSVHATGIIRKFQVIESSMLLSIVPFAYIGLNVFNLQPECVFFIHIAVEIVTEFARLYIVLPLIHMKIFYYFKKVIVPILLVTSITPILPIVVNNIVISTTINFFSVCISCVISTITTIYIIGCNKQEKIFIRSQIQNIARKIASRLRVRSCCR